MFDVIKMMHSLSHLSFEELLALSVSESSQSCSKPSKVELITAIIANRAYMADHPTPAQEERRNFRLHTEDTTRYLRLTDEQAAMLDWCIEREINFYDAELEEMEDIRWETP